MGGHRIRCNKTCSVARRSQASARQRQARVASPRPKPWHRDALPYKKKNQKPYCVVAATQGWTALAACGFEAEHALMGGCSQMETHRQSKPSTAQAKAPQAPALELAARESADEIIVSSANPASGLAGMRSAPGCGKAHRHRRTFRLPTPQRTSWLPDLASGADFAWRFRPPSLP